LKEGSGSKGEKGKNPGNVREELSQGTKARRLKKKVLVADFLKGKGGRGILNRGRK